MSAVAEPLLSWRIGNLNTLFTVSNSIAGPASGHTAGSSMEAMIFNSPPQNS